MTSAGSAGRPAARSTRSSRRCFSQLYRQDAALAPEDAKRDIETLDDALETPATSTATLAVQPGNQRVLAILAQLQRSDPSPHVQRALAAVADGALAESCASAGKVARASSTPRRTHCPRCSTASFSPGTTLRATTDLAASNARFGRARDSLWAAASTRSVFDGSAALVAGNPALQGDAARRLTGMSSRPTAA